MVATLELDGRSVSQERLRTEVTVLHTLGPEGTNCELAARTWFDRAGVDGEVILHPTLEEAADAVLGQPGAALLACIAYPELHTLIYTRYHRLVLVDSLIMPTHSMVLAARTSRPTIRTVATHPAPVTLVPDGAAVQLVTSNSQAARDCADGLVDACITTAPAMVEHGLELVQDFGPLSMGFTVHAQREQLPEPAGYC
jgi:hypothetical protein